jgi:uncharacterized protein YegP (UPF0339 family)
MAARFELVLDDAGWFHFQLRSQAGSVLLRSAAAPSKIRAQADVLNTRTALRDPARLGRWQGADGFPRIVITKPDGSLLARSPRLTGDEAVPQVAKYILAASERAPVIDLTKYEPAAH